MKREERITFEEQKQADTNEFNEPIYDWVNITTDPTMWAKAMPLTGGEDFREVQEQGIQRYQFKVLFRDDLDIEMRISWNGKKWDIRSITPIHKGARHKKLEIIAEWKQGQYE